MKASEKEALVHECLVKNYEKYYRMAYSYVFCEQDAMDISSGRRLSGNPEK